MVQSNGVKYACETCIRGHRVSTCSHADRPLIMIRPKGRPISQCGHCREARKSRTAHHTCHCGLQQQQQQLPTIPLFKDTVSVVDTKDSRSDLLLGDHPSRQCFCAYDGNCLCANRSSKSISKPRKLSRANSTSSRASRDKSLLATKAMDLNMPSITTESGSSSGSSVSSPLIGPFQQQNHHNSSHRGGSAMAMPRSHPQPEQDEKIDLHPPPIDVSSDLYQDLFGEYNILDNFRRVDDSMFFPPELGNSTDTTNPAVLDSRLSDLVILDQTTAELDRLSRSPPLSTDQQQQYLTLSDFELHEEV